MLLCHWNDTGVYGEAWPCWDEWHATVRPSYIISSSPYPQWRRNCPVLIPKSLRPSMTRSEVMSQAPGKDIKPEMIIRHGLHVLGFRYRLHDKRLPKRPDIMLPRWPSVTEVRGCYWHGHEGRGRLPKTRQGARTATLQRLDCTTLTRAPSDERGAFCSWINSGRGSAPRP